MGVGTSNTKRVDADSLSAVLWEGRRHNRYGQFLLRKGNCASWGCQVSPLGAFCEGVRRGNDTLLGFGSENLMFGGIVRCSRARTALITLLMPEQPSE